MQNKVKRATFLPFIQPVESRDWKLKFQVNIKLYKSSKSSFIECTKTFSTRIFLHLVIQMSLSS